MQHIEIVEILRPAEQGRSEPYLCRGEDDLHYFVKGRQTDRRSLWCEWVCCHLALAFGLPVPPFRVVHISPLLLEEARPELRNIGHGPAFGSEHVTPSQWFEPALISRIPKALRRDILVFDWWVRNIDRMDANPNLLWEPDNESTKVIDFNQAFDPAFTLDDFRVFHLFRAEIQAVFGDLAERARYLERLEQALAAWDDACNNAPPEWAWENDERDVPTTFDPASLRLSLAGLLDPRNPDCWRIK